MDPLDKNYEYNRTFAWPKILKLFKQRDLCPKSLKIDKHLFF